jgi:hypothetical protein
MIANATKDAKERAEKIAENAGSSLGNLKKATMGVIQITAPNSNEDYSTAELTTPLPRKRSKHYHKT